MNVWTAFFFPIKIKTFSSWRFSLLQNSPMIATMYSLAWLINLLRWIWQADSHWKRWKFVLLSTWVFFHKHRQFKVREGAIYILLYNLHPRTLISIHLSAVMHQRCLTFSQLLFLIYLVSLIAANVVTRKLM